MRTLILLWNLLAMIKKEELQKLVFHCYGLPEQQFPENTAILVKS